MKRLIFTLDLSDLHELSTLYGSRLPSEFTENKFSSLRQNRGVTGVGWWRTVYHRVKGSRGDPFVTDEDPFDWVQHEKCPPLRGETPGYYYSFSWTVDGSSVLPKSRNFSSRPSNFYLSFFSSSCLIHRGV